MVLKADPYTDWGFDISQYNNNDEWQLLNVSSAQGNRFCSSNLKFYMHFARKPFYYIINIAMPIIVLSMMSLGVFWLPPNADEKLGLSTVIFLSYSIFSLIVVQNLPTTSDAMPLLGKSHLSRLPRHKMYNFSYLRQFL